jgi:predicted RNase H-like nuclease (RuvC/YqgF family)
MCKIRIPHILAGLLLALGLGAQGFAQSSESRPSDARENALVKASSSRFNDLEIVVRAEQHAETLRAKLFDLQLQELELQARLDDLDYRMTPESIQQTLVFIGSTRPIDERREALRTRFENEKARVNKLLEMLAANRERLEAAISKADAEVERLRQQLGMF